MRIVVFAAGACLALAACGRPETNQADNDHAKVSKGATPPANAMVMLAAAPNKEVALKVMHERHEGMEAIGKANKAIHRELQGGSPDLAVVRASAARIADLSGKASGWFSGGTGPEMGKTGAKPEIWRNPEDFTSKLRAFQKAAPAFNTVAGGSDVEAIKTGFGDLGKSCKACHDKYRSEMHH